MNVLTFARFITLLIAIVMLTVSCDRKHQATTSEKLWPAGSPRSSEITCDLAIYYLPVPKTDPIARLDALLAEKYPNLQRTNTLPDGVAGIFIVAALETNVPAEYPPPDMQSLGYFGRGLSREQALAVQKSQQAMMLRFRYPKEHVWKGARLSLESAADLAQETGGLLWDHQTRELFSLEAWRTNRITTWDTDVPNILKHTTIHAYRREEKGFVRAITLGMAKFGLPDIVIEDFSWSDNRHMGHLINLFAQALAEGAVLTKPGEFDLDIRSINHPDVREPQLTTLKSNATGMAMLSLREGKWEQGDPINRLVEINFDRYEANDRQARQEKLLLTMFGWEESVLAVRSNEELAAASDQARAKLPELRERFNKGLAPGEYILVKVPFSVPSGGREYMWVEIGSWKGDVIRGLLKNEPENIPDLHGGQNVTVSEATVFDYIHTRPDGSQDGNETSKIIEAQQQGSPR